MYAPIYYNINYNGGASPQDPKNIDNKASEPRNYNLSDIMINMVLTHIFFVLAKYRRKGARVVRGCGWRKRHGGAGARNAIVALTMPRRDDAGGCGWMRVEGCTEISKIRITIALARGALVKRVVGRVLALCVGLPAPAWAMRHPFKCPVPFL